MRGFSFASIVSLELSLLLQNLWRELLRLQRPSSTSLVQELLLVSSGATFGEFFERFLNSLYLNYFLLTLWSPYIPCMPTNVLIEASKLTN